MLSSSAFSGRCALKELTGIAHVWKKHKTHQTHVPMSGYSHGWAGPPSRSIMTIMTITFTITFTIITSKWYLWPANILLWEEATFSMYPTTKANFPNWTKNLVHFSICACHPCAGAILIFSVSFPISSDDPRRESNRGLPNRGEAIRKDMATTKQDRLFWMSRCNHLRLVPRRVGWISEDFLLPPKNRGPGLSGKTSHFCLSYYVAKKIEFKFHRNQWKWLSLIGI